MTLVLEVPTHQLAHRLHARIPALREVLVWLCSRIGAAIDAPQMVSVQVHLQAGNTLADVIPPIRETVQAELRRMPAFCRELASGRDAGS